MSIARHHSEWLSLVEVSGPFLSMPVLMRVFPQGLEAHDSERFRTLRAAYEEWEEKQGTGKFNPAIHVAWIKFILNEILELPDEVILQGQAVPQPLQATIAEQGETLRPDLVIKNPDGGPNAGKPRLLIQTYQFTQDLDKPVSGKTWKATPGTRMMELLHGTGIRLGLVTNGERWMLVDAPKGETTGFASWYAHLWLEEQITFRAFRSLLNVERFFNVSDADTLDSLLAESASNQQEVTEQLGYQVRKAVEVLIQSLDRADQDHGRELLKDVSETELYEAALTVMMRLVFLFCAEERGLLLLDDELYAEHYAVSTVREQLRETADQHGEEILERRHDAWCRLLSTFRVVYGGVEHDRMTLPAYGGRLFDPDRFAFLEGRKKGTTWRESTSDPLPVNNRTVLHLLEALQILQVRVPGGGPAEARRLSFRALDIEQIGHVYEGLLDHTAKRANEPILGLAGTRDREPEVALSRLEAITAKGNDAFTEYLKEETGRSASALKKTLTGELNLDQAHKLEAACGTDRNLWKRIQPFGGLIRNDTFGHAIVISSGSVYVTAGTDRRSSGTHYTPRILTEPIVQYTLEPLVYIGPAEGKPKEQWQLRTPAELLDLKICDMTCGSGAFLVQGCRYLSERVVEAWELAEKAHPGVPGITPEGKPSSGQPGEVLIPKETDERMIYARRLVAQRCLYGVDKNPLAVEMAKLSLWLLTLAKDKPFEFLDHAIRCGDSLIGIHKIEQLRKFNLDGKGEDNSLFLRFLDPKIKEAIALRRQITEMQANTVEDVKAQEQILREVNEKIDRLKCAADMLISAEFVHESAPDKRAARDDAAIKVAVHFNHSDLPTFRREARKALGGQATFYWPLEFPEVMVERGGFDAFVGNPPFMGGLKLETAFGSSWRDYVVNQLAEGRRGVRGTADLCAYFFLRACQLLRAKACLGLLATNTIAQGDTKEICLDAIGQSGMTIVRAFKSMKWPGAANLEVAVVWLRKGGWTGPYDLDEEEVSSIAASLTPHGQFIWEPQPLQANVDRAFQGANVLGSGFILDKEEAESVVKKDPKNRDIVFPYLTGEDLNSRHDQSPSRWIICFHGWDLKRAQCYPDCIRIVEERVKPERDRMIGKNPAATRRGTSWWRYGQEAKALHEAARKYRRILVRSRVSNLNLISFSSTDVIFSDATVAFLFDDFINFAVLQSIIHTLWAEEFSSSMRTDVRYTPSRCFETFPFPGLSSDLERIGGRYFDSRNQIMLSRHEGLTRTYNRFHNPEEINADIQKLRQLHVEMDNTVAAAYGWTDLDLGHGFHETKQSVRYTISEPARREVLARLLKLNHERYAEEVAQGLHDKKRGAGSGAREAKRQRKTTPETGQMMLADIAAGNDDEQKEAEPEESTPPSKPEPQANTRAVEELDYDDLIQAIRTVAASDGEMPREEFIVAVARELGYARTGSKIHDAIDGAIRAAARRGIVETGFFGVHRGKVKIGDWSRDDLVDALCSVMRKGSRLSRDEAITLAASHIGFKRVGKSIDEAFRSAINGGIRRGVISYEGDLIWRES